jgi:hypothetical protein
MKLPTKLQGRPFGPEELAQVQALIRNRSGWSRYRLSRELAQLWGWRTPQGQLKDMAARTLLLKLQKQGWIELPALRMRSLTRSGRLPRCSDPALEQSPVGGALKQLLPLRLEEVSQRPARRQLEAAPWVVPCSGRPPGNAPCATNWIGWSPQSVPASWGQIVNNTRFALFSWVRVAHANCLSSRQVKRVFLMIISGLHA